MMDFKRMSNTQFEMIIDQRIFSQDVIFKSTNWLLDKYNVFHNQIDEYYLNIKLEAKNNSFEIDADQLLNKINLYLNDYKTREIIFKQTKNIRDILMIKAFSNLGSISEEILNANLK